ncbi:MAG: MFS transporter [Pseudomonadota bacterium]
MSEFKKGWPTLLGAMVGTMCGVQTLTAYTQGFFAEPLTSEFVWSRAQFFLSFSVLQLAGVVTAPIVGALGQRYGLKLIGIIGLIGHAIAYVILAQNNGSLAFFYFSFVLVAVLGAGSLPIVWTSAINNWFVKNRGTAIGITMAGTGLGAFILPPIVVGLTDAYGWRLAYMAIGLGSLAVSLPIILAFFKEGKVEAEDGASTVNEKEKPTWGLTRAEAMKTHQFWLLGAVLFFTVLAVGGMLSNFPLIMGEEGLTRQQIAPIAGAMGISVVIGRVTVGILADRFWAPAIGAVVFAIMALGVLTLAISPSISPTVALLIAISIGFAAGAELDLLVYLTGKYFGTRYFSEVFGVVFVFFSIGGGIAGPLYGAVSQAAGSYTNILFATVGVLALSITLFIALGRYPEAEQLDT